MLNKGDLPISVLFNKLTEFTKCEFLPYGENWCVSRGVCATGIGCKSSVT